LAKGIVIAALVTYHHWREAVMGKQQRFEVGDRVRTIRPTTGVEQNVVGTVQIVFLDADLYSIRFDGLRGFRIVHHLELEVAPQDQPHTTE